MQWVGVVGVLMGLILMLIAERVTGLGFEMRWRRNEPREDARAAKPSC